MNCSYTWRSESGSINDLKSQVGFYFGEIVITLVDNPFPIPPYLAHHVGDDYRDSPPPLPGVGTNWLDISDGTDAFGRIDDTHVYPGFRGYTDPATILKVEAGPATTTVLYQYVGFWDLVLLGNGDTTKPTRGKNGNARIDAFGAMNVDKSNPLSWVITRKIYKDIDGLWYYSIEKTMKEDFELPHKLLIPGQD